MPNFFRKGRTLPSSLLLFRLATFFCVVALSTDLSMEMKKRLLLGATTVASRQRNVIFSAHAYTHTHTHTHTHTQAQAYHAYAWVPVREHHRGRRISTSSLTRKARVTPHISAPTHRLSSTSSTKDSTSSDIPSTNYSPTDAPPNERASLLNRCLDAVLASSSVTSQELMEAALSSLRDPSAGYDPKFGRPALRAYRSFVYPKKQQQQQEEEPDTIQLEAVAKRTANQIDFLVKRQTSRMNEAVRNHDDPNSIENGNGTDSSLSKFPITLVLDNLRGSFNVGSIFRTAEACGVSEILTCGITPHPFGSGAEKVAKSALGADLLVPTAHFGTTYEALQSLKQREKEGTAQEPPFVVALETTVASKLYTSVDYRPYYEPDGGGKKQGDDNNEISKIQNNGRGIALILGNEVTGVDVELLAPLLQNEESSSNLTLVDAIVELPTHGQKNSLNVAAVAPVILYEILRQWDSDSATK